MAIYIAFITIVLFAVSLLVYMYIEAHSNRILFHQLFFPDFPESFGEVNIFFISDIHRRTVSDTIISEAKGKADFVVIGGDLTETGVKLKLVEENIDKLRLIGPVYFVWGNNDYDEDAHELDALLLNKGVKILDNTAVRFESESGDILVLIGVDDVALYRDRLDLALLDAGSQGFKILASHNPQIIKQVSPEHHIRLLLSGHTHGGQIRIFGFGPYEKGGIRQAGSTTVLVSNGYGTTALPLRLGAKPETHLISIKHKSSGQDKWKE
ncbi:metallophosphoesterase [Bacillus sp. T33-2]|uniref:metallophosphoesterase n=1 Tax=Bacillus sp. T33-2 TaxID=2054168 RepID=UPI000C767A0C|nr:metallophosphoesterase [Bacillus sp. T33-2]PLR99773.1 metallophosphoesterase [Bacillus sp. T33-2]